MKHISYPSIEQFRNVIHDVKHQARFVGLDVNGEPQYNPLAALPIIKFTGTVKLHGTNAGVSYNKEDGLWVQSRSNIITPEKDNAGFAFFVEQNREWFEWLLKGCYEAQAHNYGYKNHTITLYGEWCGSGIQKGVGISELPKMFVIFGLKVSFEDENPSEWITIKYEYLIENLPENIYNIYQFPTYEMEIDFNYPELAQNKLVEITDQVEKECPVAKQLGVSGTGEGVVWTGTYKGNNYRFKVKGQLHSSSKVKTTATVDVEKVNSIREFIEYAVTENRMNQAIEYVFTQNGETPNIKGMGNFIRWIFNDIIKEELDTLKENNLEPKEIGSAVSNKVRPWFQEYLNKQEGL